jgi:diamine N-acetyltransferase
VLPGLRECCEEVGWMFEGLLVDLVPFSAEFKQHEVAWMNGPMGEWWGQDGLLTQPTLDRNQEQWLATAVEQGRYLRFGMRAKDGNPIGTFGLANVRYDQRTAEVGAGIGDPSYWSGGFGSDAMLLIVEYGFRWLDLRRLWLTTAGLNERAQRQVEKCGFALEGRQRRALRIRGGFGDFLFYGMLREEWPGRAVMVERLGLREKAKARGYV